MVIFLGDGADDIVLTCLNHIFINSPMGFMGSSSRFLYYLLVIFYIAIEAMAIEIVDLPIDSMVIFHSYVNVYQRVSSVFMILK